MDKNIDITKKQLIDNFNKIKNQFLDSYNKNRKNWIVGIVCFLFFFLFLFANTKPKLEQDFYDFCMRDGYTLSILERDRDTYCDCIAASKYNILTSEEINFLTKPEKSNSERSLKEIGKGFNILGSIDRKSFELECTKFRKCLNKIGLSTVSEEECKKQQEINVLKEHGFY